MARTSIKESPAAQDTYFGVTDMRRRILLPALLLVVVTFAVYFQVRAHPFFGMDDSSYVVDNVHIKNGITLGTIQWAFTHVYAQNWHPLTWLSHALDIQLFQLDPAGPHLENAVLHAINAALLFWVLVQATGFVGRSWMVAALFALHPVNVESVAWVAERKTMLSMLFFLLALAAYRWYAAADSARLANYGVRQRQISSSMVRRYVVVAMCYWLGLMAKPQIITLPVLLLLWDYWPLQRMFVDPGGPSSDSGRVKALPARSLTWLLIEKLPLMLVCAVGALVTLKAQSKGIVKISLAERFSPENWAAKLPVRLENAAFSYAKYIGKALWPSSLAPQYPLPGASLKEWHALTAAALLLAITALVIVARRRHYLVTGWFWFLIALVPMIGLIQAGRQAMADRYAYGAFLGLFIMVCWGVPDLLAKILKSSIRDQNNSRSSLTVASAGLSALVLLALTVVTYRQIGFWKDDLTLWTHATQVVKNHWEAEDSIGTQLMAMGRPAEAMPHFFRAAEIFPQDFRSNLEVALYQQRHGEPREAIKHYENALAGIDEHVDDSVIYQNMGIAYRQLGDLEKASECFAMARLKKN